MRGLVTIRNVGRGDYWEMVCTQFQAFMTSQLINDSVCWLLHLTVEAMEVAQMGQFSSWKKIMDENLVLKSSLGHYPPKWDGVTNPLLRHVAFHQAPMSSGPQTNGYLREDPYLSLPRGEASGLTSKHDCRKYAWSKHVIARRSFAVFPPVRGMDCWCFWPFRELQVSSKLGITMEHFIRALEAE